MRTLLITGLVYFLSSCQSQNFSKVHVKGLVLDRITGNPIANANVAILCWYHYGMDDATYEKRELRSNAKGEFEATCEKGYQVDCAAVSQGYNPGRLYHELSNKTLVITLSLQRVSNNPGLIYRDNGDFAIFDTTSSKLFLGVRIYPKKGSNELDYKTATPYGYDLKTLKLTRNLNNSDVWFREVRTSEQPKIIVAHRNGGLIPIFEREIESSALFEKSIAPDKGYLSEYTLTGEETGFFIKCRDGKTYAKIIFEKSEISGGIPDQKGSYYQEVGRNFTLLYQTNGSRNLSYSNSNINLEGFLVDFRLR